MNSKLLSMSVDKENGIKRIHISDKKPKYSVSLSDEGSKFLDSLGADIILDFDDEDRLISIELIGF